MLRNKPRAAVSSKQALMADHSSQSSSSTSTTQNYAKPIPSFFGSPRFKAFTKRGLTTDLTESLKSPTSILDNNKPLFPFGYDIINQPKSPKLFSPPEKPESKGIGLAIDVEDKTYLQTSNKKVLFGTELKVQIPPPLQVQVQSCLVSPTDFGTKTRNSHLSSSPFGSPNSGFHKINTKDSPNFTSPLPVKEMELSEDYTCVISHGPNPKTTHIFDNCIVENYCSVNSDDKPMSAPETQSFLSFCHTCKKNLEQKIDIYIYRGEKAFCSQECRYQEMRLDGDEN